MKVRFTQRAQRRAKLVAEWWRQHRPVAPALFEEELAGLVGKRVERPTVGIVYQTLDGQVIRRRLMPRTAQHVYYSVDESNLTIVIHAVWGARRGRDPRL